MSMIKKKSIEQNKSVRITGVLISVDEYFIEILEGPRKKLTSLLKQIINNPAHHNLIILDISVIDEREFPDFPKDACFVFSSDEKFVNRYIVQDQFNPYELSVGAITELSRDVVFYEALRRNDPNFGLKARTLRSAVPAGQTH